MKCDKIQDDVSHIYNGSQLKVRGAKGILFLEKTFKQKLKINRSRSDKNYHQKGKARAKDLRQHSGK